jgi:hypothetical protein
MNREPVTLLAHIKLPDRGAGLKCFVEVTGERLSPHFLAIPAPIRDADGYYQLAGWMVIHEQSQAMFAYSVDETKWSNDKAQEFAEWMESTADFSAARTTILPHHMDVDQWKDQARAWVAYLNDRGPRPC